MFTYGFGLFCVAWVMKSGNAIRSISAQNAWHAKITIESITILQLYVTQRFENRCAIYSYFGWYVFFLSSLSIISCKCFAHRIIVRKK